MNRIFLIGNGPSLNLTPLDLLVNEDTFAMNRIHLIYGKTKWRPTYFYYVDHHSQDRDWRSPIEANREARHLWLLDYYRDGLSANHPNHRDFTPDMAVGDIPNTTWLSKCKRHAYYAAGNPRAMQEWHLPEICTAYNGMSSIMQIAVQMGYKEIYLLGCDMGYQYDYSKNHFDPHYNDSILPTGSLEPLRAYMFQSDELNVRTGHEIAKRECDARGVKVYNATIGGHLEIYPRVDLREIL